MNDAIFIILNRNHFHYAIALLNSLSINWPVHPTILCNHTSDLTEDQLNKLKSYDKLILNSLELSENEIGKCPPHKSSGMMVAYGKLRMWSQLYEEYDNILFLDVDTLVLKPLDKLISRNEFTIFRAEYKMDFLVKSNELRSLLEEDYISTYFNDDFKYDGIIGNSGVMVLPKSIRSEENYDSLMNILHRYKNYNRLADQAIINLWMLKNGLRPDLTSIKYNFLTFYLNPRSEYWTNTTRLEDEFDNIHIVHFVLKPDQILSQPFNITSPKSMECSQKLFNSFNYYLNT